MATLQARPILHPAAAHRAIPGRSALGPLRVGRAALGVVPRGPTDPGVRSCHTRLAISGIRYQHDPVAGVDTRQITMMGADVERLQNGRRMSEFRRKVLKVDQNSEGVEASIARILRRPARV